MVYSESTTRCLWNIFKFICLKQHSAQLIACIDCDNGVASVKYLGRIQIVSRYFGLWLPKLHLIECAASFDLSSLEKLIVFMVVIKS